MMESQDTICAWTEATFGTASSNARVAARANEEMAELLRALTSDDNHPKAVEEAADVVIILYRLAHRMGKNLHTEIDAKMAINRAREWKVTNGHGYHVRDKSAPRSSQETAGE
jgi:NTP pyrophosphatase (non-canonical NTP hydrolase)